MAMAERDAGWSSGRRDLALEVIEMLGPRENFTDRFGIFPWLDKIAEEGEA
jgi:hypothetical protein